MYNDYAATKYLVYSLENIYFDVLHALTDIRDILPESPAQEAVARVSKVVEEYGDRAEKAVKGACTRRAHRSQADGEFCQSPLSLLGGQLLVNRQPCLGKGAAGEFLHFFVDVLSNEFLPRPRVRGRRYNIELSSCRKNTVTFRGQSWAPICTKGVARRASHHQETHQNH